MVCPLDQGFDLLHIIFNVDILPSRFTSQYCIPAVCAESRVSLEHLMSLANGEATRFCKDFTVEYSSLHPKLKNPNCSFSYQLPFSYLNE